MTDRAEPRKRAKNPAHPWLWWCCVGLTAAVVTAVSLPPAPLPERATATRQDISEICAAYREWVEKAAQSVDSMEALCHD